MEVMLGGKVVLERSSVSHAGMGSETLLVAECLRRGDRISLHA